MFDSSYYNSMKIFLASPSDARNERQIAEDVISKLDRVSRATLGLRTECFKWEHMPPLTPSPEDGHIQDVILREQVLKCNVFVLILNKRYGSTTSGNKVSNTELEVETAFKMLERKRNIMLLSYFRKNPDNTDPGKQEKKLRELKNKLREKELWYQEYSNLEDFKEKITHDLYYVAIRFQSAVTKQRSLRAFWDLGNIEELGSPKLSIIYPPLDRGLMQHDKPDHIWFDRLVPVISFEDAKTISKIEKSLRLIGHHQIDTYATLDFPPTIYDTNRVWLCLPRNNPAIRQMKNYEEEAWFRFEPRRGKIEGSIYWRPPSDTEFFTIHSPLAKYLQLQRSALPGGDWTPSHGRIIAKDYAILARFMDKRETRLKDYFIAGLRGLGTWGAGWFIDRRYKSFLKWENQDDVPIQMLLEVTYKNAHIVDVRDVSQMSASYFEDECSLSTVKKRIKELQDR